jgi:two-component system response regulator HydG
MRKILIIDDDTYMCNLLVDFLQQKGYTVKGAFTGKSGRRLVRMNDFDVVLCDFRLPDSDGEDILKFIRSVKPATSVIIMTAYSDIKMAVSLIKSGAFDYVTKPVQPEEILQLINNASEEKDRNDKKNKVNTSFNNNFITGKSSRMKEVMKHVSAISPTEVTVLIEGETGSGKEYIARAIHIASNRSDKPFIAVDCGAIPGEIANSELFGHVKGAFTGAINDKTGYYEQANGGTLFLDEVGNLLPENQLKLLRALEDKFINKVGDNKPIRVDVRIIAASNVNLLDKTRSSEFREDLYHRLNGFKIRLPSLRQRRADIMEFTDFFIKKANNTFNKNVKGIDHSVKDLFMQYKWYGNIRELKNIIFRAVLLSRTDLITSDLLPEEIKINYLSSSQEITGEDVNIEDITELKEAVVLTEKEVIMNALVRSGYNKSKAARLLNIDRKTLYNKLRLHKIDPLK